jgi:hypothetical protein
MKNGIIGNRKRNSSKEITSMQTILEVPGLVFGYRKKQVKFQNLSTQSHEIFWDPASKTIHFVFWLYSKMFLRIYSPLSSQLDSGGSIQ